VARLNEEVVKSLPAPESGNKITYYPDAILQGTKTPPGFGVRVTANGARSFILNYRSNRVERRITIGAWPTWSVLAAVREARKLKQRIDRGEDPLADRRKVEAASRDTFANIMAEFFTREGGKLRSAKPRRQMLERLVIPEFGNRDIGSIKRSEIIRLLDRIADTSGQVSANRVKAYMSRIFNWHAGRADDFTTPFVRGMGYGIDGEEPRQRVLSDDEIRAVWKAAERPFGQLVKFILLTGARRAEAALMERKELIGSDWTLPASRNKTGLDLLRPLSPQAMAVLPSAPGQFVFNCGYALERAVKELHEVSGTSAWTLHDLRRTSRTLMSRAGVPVDHAERALGHVIGGIRGVYDVYEYKAEKELAYKALGALIERIVDPPADNVTALRGRAS
jgi:integrase